MKHQECLERAGAAIVARETDYGAPAKNFARVAALWTAYGARIGGFDVRPHDVPNMLILLKIARGYLPGHDDNWVDIAGYAALGAGLTNKQ